MDPLLRYRNLWDRPGPPGVFTPGMFRPGAHPALRVHRRVLTGYPSGRLAPAVWPVNLWRSGRWWSDRAAPRPDTDLQQRFEEVAGVPVVQQETRLAVLAARGIGPRDAYRFGLLLDGARDRWMQYLYGHEMGWNVAAGGWPSARSVALLADKWATTRRLAVAGVPTVPTRRIRAGTEVSDSVLRGWLDGRAQVFLKPVVGSGGEGAFTLAGPTPVITPYGSAVPVADPVRYARERLAGRDHLCQPLLVSHAVFAAADPVDVVTVRIVTRDLGAGPRVFSVAVELPLRSGTGSPSYCHVVVDPAGRLRGRPQPPWSPPPADPRAARLLRAVTGLGLPDHLSMTTEALAAHRQFPGVFAIAWDVAATPHGPVFLEGNGGFATAVPQMAAGGLLVGVTHLR